jgi:putative membrane protein
MLRPVRELGFWQGRPGPVSELTFCVAAVALWSVIYEVVEWAVAAIVDPAAGTAYLGTQGDEWDAQKDMALAGVGALLAMLIIAGVNLAYNPDFAREFRDSFRIPAGDEPLGEERLRRWLQSK